MELEGFGVSLIGRFTWVYGTDQLPWEFLQGSQHTMKVLIKGAAQPTLAEAEAAWTCVWHPTQTRDWSCIATILRSVGVGSCMVALEHVDVPATFWSFLESMQREGRTVVSRIWVNDAPPPLVPDATFFAAVGDAVGAQRMMEVFTALPARAGHTAWQPPVDDWLSVVRAAYDADMGLMVSDLEEHAWTLMWHRPADSRPIVERRIPTAQHWLRIGMKCLGDRE